jgi:hypothetical protein
MEEVEGNFQATRMFPTLNDILFFVIGRMFSWLSSWFARPWRVAVFGWGERISSFFLERTTKCLLGHPLTLLHPPLSKLTIPSETRNFTPFTIPYAHTKNLQHLTPFRTHPHLSQCYRH